MTEFFNSLVGFEKVLWGIAIFTSVIFVIQFIMVIFGGDADSETDLDTDFDTDIDVDPGDVDHAQEDTGFSFAWLSFRNLVNFFLLFSWVGISCFSHGLSVPLALLISSASGLLWAFLVVLMYKGMSKLQQDGSPKLSSIIGNTCVVYLTVPKDGRGKVNVTIGGGNKTLDAISKTEDFKTGTIVKIVDVINGIIVVDVNK